MSAQQVAPVRRPISFKIFGIAVSLLILMISVTVSSSSNLHRLGQQLNLLSDYYIEMEQRMGDLRSQTLREVILIERVLHAKPKNITSDDDTALALFQEAGDCGAHAMRPVLAKVREVYADRAELQMMLYRISRLCTNEQLAKTNALVEKGLARSQVLHAPELASLFTTIKSELDNIPPSRTRLHESVEKYVAQVQSGDTKVLAAAQEQIDERRQEVNRRINGVARAVHASTAASAELVEGLERRTQWMNWSVALAVCVLALLVAFFITRNLMRLVEEMREKALIKDTFGKYVDPRIVQELIASQKDFSKGSERQHMSVFFSDLEGFTSASEKLTPTRTVRLLNLYFSLMAEPIRVQHGIIDKYIGDSVMAFWGPPFSAAKEHALQACTAALAQQAKLPHFQELLPEVLGNRKKVPAIRVRMGIASGDVTVGTIGSEESRSYTVIGDNVNLASRLEGTNKLYKTSILISAATRRLAGDAIEVREIDAIRVMGKTDPVGIYELIGLKGDISPAMVQLREVYERGLTEYRARNWAAAAATFATCLEMNPEDGPSKLFALRVKVLSTQELPDTWDGVWTMTEK